MFFYTLPILFNDIQSVKPLECLFALGGLLLLVWISTPLPDRNWRTKPYDSYLLAAWLGELGLQNVFWPFFILLNTGLFFADYLAKSGKITVSSWDDIHFVLLITVAWWITGVWRCSANTHSKSLAAVARLATLAVLIEFGLKLYLRIDFPRLYFNCEDILLDYGSCF